MINLLCVYVSQKLIAIITIIIFQLIAESLLHLLYILRYFIGLALTSYLCGLQVWHIVVNLKCLPQYGVVRFLRHVRLSTSVKCRHIPANCLYHPVAWGLLICNAVRYDARYTGQQIILYTGRFESPQGQELGPPKVKAKVVLGGLNCKIISNCCVNFDYTISSLNSGLVLTFQDGVLCTGKTTGIHVFNKTSNISLPVTKYTWLFNTY